MEQDTLGDFLVTMCWTNDPTVEISAMELFQAYEGWCRTSGEKPLTAKAFGLRLGERGFVPTRTSHERRWTGLRLRSPMDPDPGDAPEPVTLNDAISGKPPSREAIGGVYPEPRHHTSPAPEETTSDCFDPPDEEVWP